MIATYTEVQIQHLRDRWKGHEEQLKALIPVLKVYLDWHESNAYKALMEALEPLPEGIETVKRDLRGVDLSYVTIIGAHLNEAYLLFADLSGARLLGADLCGANLQDVTLSHASLLDARLDKADLRGAVLIEANLMGAHLNEANLNGVKLRGANLIGADLRGIRFFAGVDFADVKWWGSKITEGSQFASYLRDVVTPSGKHKSRGARGSCAECP